ncbi:GNAT family N-acetyltransferase [Oceanibium sediminis]|uniref:GNAT family N-acetyltransferase n=1 Tax=Oceanibium sediminis TaxID=2026339 RepID=UPI0013003CC0|nr:GNAT family N-acetyltransferase [Oceanibium sediminis]
MDRARVDNGLRRAGAGDLPAVRAIAQAAYAPYVARIGRRPAPMVADFGAHLAREELWVIGAPVAGYLVAYRDGDAWQIDNLAIAPHRQGQGVGAALLLAGEALARDAGAGRVTLYTNARMEGNIAWYQRCGYQLTDRRKEDGFERVFFEKPLN